jgi:excisionase family DNA binding protein
MPREMSSGFFIWRNRMSNAETKLWKLFFELEREVTRLEEENTSLKEKIKQLEEQRITKSSPVWERKDWVELESGKRFLTKKELAKYLGMSAGTISNQISSGTFPIRVKRMGQSVRFDMREILDYLETNKPFWERDKEQKEAKR